ncbi:methyltransferase domain protein [Clostridium sp. MSTE9]|uniref:class I SAM-dependent DNA methyltransferase n=1 Tax=Clostridium sp. (strain MSTE9) TaxID=1105031 RepID=UPI00026F35D9|nr:class I SAM-dependent methyltransferase [Clostridium sp. MSTE9]EJF39867.1 methyltransferase domain protein [Clostridium sp. MSTE9]
MSSYSTFAQYYDELTQNVDYAERAEYFCGLLNSLRHPADLVLDLACGTGSLTLQLKKRGLDVYGADASYEMLSVAQQKAAEAEQEILFLCQPMQKLDLYGTVDTVICALDSINHLTSERDVLAAFRRVSLFLNPGGYFLFDMNTLYKHREVLANHIFLYDTDHVYCVWQNHYEEKTDRVGIHLDFFGKEGALYRRSSEHFYERAYSIEKIGELLHTAGLTLTACYDDCSMEPPRPDSERVVVVARKEPISESEKEL